MTDYHVKVSFILDTLMDEDEIVEEVNKAIEKEFCNAYHITTVAEKSDEYIPKRRIGFS